MIQKQIEEPLPLASDQFPDLPPAVDTVIQKATAKTAQERYSNILAFAAAFSDAAMPAVEASTAANLANLDVDIPNPYKGLRAFQEADTDRFFGRELFVDRLVDQLTQNRFLAVVGPSGSGKSSVVKAGLLPALRQGAVPGSENWFVAEMTPGAYPLEELEAALLHVAVYPPPSLLEPLQKDERGLVRTLKRILPVDRSTDGRSQLLLIIDQFEELFTMVTEESRRHHFLNSLLEALNEPYSRLQIVITLRADFYDRPLQVPELGQLLRQHTEIVLPLTHSELEQVIIGPAARAGVHLESGLAGAMMVDIADQPGALPLLQYALTELFDKREGQIMSQAAYQEIGGVLGALGRRAEEIYQDLDDFGRESTRQIFLRLVTLGEGTEDTRRRVALTELEAIFNNQQPITGAGSLLTDVSLPLTEYGRYRLLTFDRDPGSRTPTVEVAHESLLREWPRLANWLEESRDDVRKLRLLATFANEWQAAAGDDGFLLRGSRLDQFSGWAENATVALTQNEDEFLAASLAMRQTRQTAEEARRQRELETAQQLAETERARAETESKRAVEQASTSRRLRWLAAGLALLTLVAIAASLWAQQQSHRAEQQTRLANARELAAAAVSNLALDPERSILLALSAVQTTYAIDQTVVPEAETVLHQAVSAAHTSQTLAGHRSDLSKSSWVTDIAFSPDGSRLVTASGDNTVKVWDASSGEEILSITGDNSPFGFWGVAYSQDGTLIAAGSSNNSIIVWDARTGEKMKVLGGPAGHTGDINRIAFSPDDGRLASTSVDGTVRIWDLETNGILEVNSTIDGKPIFDVAFSPDSLRLATTSEDMTAKMWDVATGEELQTFDGHQEWVWRVFFSPDGSQIVTTSPDDTAIIWDSFTGERLRMARS